MLKFKTFEGKNGVPLAWRHYPAEGNKAVVFLTGRWEYFPKYEELYDKLNLYGYHVFTYDHRGQGFSGRVLDDPQKGHVENFSDYVEDMETFMDTIVLPEKIEDIFALSHSMGGAVSFLYMEKHPEVFKASVFSSPMFKIGSFILPESLIETVVKVSSINRKDTDYAPTCGPYNPNRPFRNNFITHDYMLYKKMLLFYKEHPEAVLGDPTVGWIREAVKACRYIREKAENFSVPFLLFQGGKDKVVDASGQNTVCEKAKNAEKMVFPDAWHEILYEIDTIRVKAHHSLIAYFERFCSDSSNN
ncbi:MAG: alpha/beta fold hydrolase [bacterium]